MKATDYNWIQLIFALIDEKRGLDLSGLQRSTAAARIQTRLDALSKADYKDYFACLKQDPEELDRLIDALTINVSAFFRDPFTFEYVSTVILPVIFHEKSGSSEKTLRVWSAGCSTGEEAYTIAILMTEAAGRERREFGLNVFATDIDRAALDFARDAVYPREKLENVRYGLLEKYFTPKEGGASYSLSPEIRGLVSFSFFDMLDKRLRTPAESVFGGFDMVLCRNLIMYYDGESRTSVMRKLYRSLDTGGFLVLGEAERLPGEFSASFEYLPESRYIYRKAAGYGFQDIKEGEDG